MDGAGPPAREPMNKAIVLLTLALVLGVAAAPTAAADCPPAAGRHCTPTPVTEGINCVSEWAGDWTDEFFTDCI